MRIRARTEPVWPWLARGTWSAANLIMPSWRTNLLAYAAHFSNGQGRDRLPWWIRVRVSQLPVASWMLFIIYAAQYQSYSIMMAVRSILLRVSEGYNNTPAALGHGSFPNNRTTDCHWQMLYNQFGIINLNTHHSHTHNTCEPPSLVPKLILDTLEAEPNPVYLGFILGGIVFWPL